MQDPNLTKRKESLTKEEQRKQAEFIEKVKKILEEKSKIIGRKLRACVVTFGCQMNERDSEKIKGILDECGYEIVEDEDADLVLYNTCTVRENANDRLYGRLGALNKKKKENKEMLIGICGCMPQEELVVSKIEQTYSFVDLIFGTFNAFKIAELLYSRLVGNSRIIDIWETNERLVELDQSFRKYPFKASVNIMYGCDNFCTYCIVPYVRGREKSRPKEEIIREIKNLVADGVIEVTLLGQNVNSYGKGLEEKENFVSLLKEVAKIDGLSRIRFMTPHPKDFSDELIELIANEEKICKHIHLPLQSGSSEILKKMNRHYTKEEYLRLVDKIREKIEDVSITTDIIVGFPNESEEDFNDTLDVVKYAKYDSAYTFIYSKRSGTIAANMENNLTKDKISKRFNLLLKTIKDISTKKATSLNFKECEVLVEGKNEQDKELVTGRLSNNMLVHFKADESLIGKIVTVRITEAKGFYYFGELKN